MKILIVAATFNEVKPFVSGLSLIKKVDENFSQFHFNDVEIHLLITGVGIASTAYKMGSVMATNHYHMAFNFGIAGAFNRKISIMTKIFKRLINNFAWNIIIFEISCN